MKTHIYIFFFLYLPCSLHSQRYDSKWLLGYWADGSGVPYGLNELTFSSSAMNLGWQDYQINFATTNTALFDSAGEVIFYSNGVAVWGPDKDTMINGSGLSPSDYTNSHAEYGLYIPQGVLALPSPRKKGEYYLFHETVKWTDSYGDRPMETYYSIIDMNILNGIGVVMSKNNLMIEDTLDIGQITACKHANGRDWWILIPQLSGVGYHSFLLSAGGVQNMGLQITGDYHPTACASQGVFSPDGAKYARYDQGDWTDEYGFLNVFNFDRCTGLLSNRQVVTIPHWVNWWGAAGVAFSPNSKVVYVNDTRCLYQYDLTAPDIASTQYLVGTYDGYESPFGSTFYQGQLAPDGKIYWSCTNGEDVLHVINQPDSLGAACNFGQHSVQLLSYNAFGLPNHPNYYLGALAGSGCDTLTAIGQPTEIANIYAYPNPTRDKLYVGMNHIAQGAVLTLSNSLGQILSHKTLESTPTETEISLGHLPTGIYYLQVQAENQIFTEKIMKE